MLLIIISTKSLIFASTADNAIRYNHYYLCYWFQFAIVFLLMLIGLIDELKNKRASAFCCNQVCYFRFIYTVWKFLFQHSRSRLLERRATDLVTVLELLYLTLSFQWTKETLSLVKNFCISLKRGNYANLRNVSPIVRHIWSETGRFIVTKMTRYYTTNYLTLKEEFWKKIFNSPAC